MTLHGRRKPLAVLEELVGARIGLDEDERQRHDPEPAQARRLFEQSVERDAAGGDQEQEHDDAEAGGDAE